MMNLSTPLQELQISRLSCASVLLARVLRPCPQCSAPVKLNVHSDNCGVRSSDQPVWIQTAEIVSQACACDLTEEEVSSLERAALGEVN